MKRSLGAALLIAAAACAGKKETAPAIQTAAVQLRDIVIEATASGAIEAINVVEVKSKASGLITQMPVETGTIVKPGDLIVQIDTRDVQSQLNQADADLNAAKEKLSVSKLQKKRSDDMFAARVITAQENETANLDLTNSSAAVLRAQGNYELAQQRFDDATIRATVGGVILEKTVAPGGVIASATGSASGGTTLVKMADLTKVRVRAFFNETDIGNVSAGQPASVTVDAYPDRAFEGLVEKIEPQAVIQQNVTMFPVLITLANEGGLLKPGMNGEVSVLVDERQGVLAVPNDAIRNPREAATMAPLLGLDPDSVDMQIKGASRGGGAGRKTGGGGGTPAADTKGAAPQPEAGRGGSAGGEVALDAVEQGAAGGQRRGGGRGGRAGGFQGTPVPAEECARITAAIDKDPAKKKQLDDLAKVTGLQGEARTANTNARNDIYKALGVDNVKAGTCRRQAGGGGAGAASGGRQGGGGAGGGRGANGLQVAPELSSGRSRAKTGLVFVSTGTSYIPKIITMGPANFDFTEVLSGLEEGDRVVLMGALALAATRAAQQEANRKKMSNPLNPNTAPQGGFPGGGGPGGGAGGGRGGDAGGGGGGGGGNRGGGGGRGGN